MSDTHQPYRLRLMASLAQQVGQPFLTVNVPEGTTGKELRQQLGNSYPHIAPLLGKSLLVAGDRILDDNVALPAGEPLALVPPVSGG